MNEETASSGLDHQAGNPLAKDPKFDEAVRRLEAWAAKYKPLCYIELAAVQEQLPLNLSGHLWTEYSWDQFVLVQAGYSQDDTTMGYVVTEIPAPVDQKTLLQTWIQEFCTDCGGIGTDEDGDPCATCAGFGEYEFTVPFEYPQVLKTWEEIQGFSANFQAQTAAEQTLAGPPHLPKKFDDDYWEDKDFYNIANIIWNFQFEASDLDRDSLQWPSDGLNPVDAFLEKYEELFVVIEKYIEEEIESTEVDSTFAEQVSACWNDLCSLYRYQGDSTFEGDFDKFLDFFNVLHYNDMGLSVQSELFTIFGGRDSSE